MIAKLRDMLARAERWPDADQIELAECAAEIEDRRAATYRATQEELAAIDDAQQSGVASDLEVEAAFKTFRRA